MKNILKIPPTPLLKFIDSLSFKRLVKASKQVQSLSCVTFTVESN